MALSDVAFARLLVDPAVPRREIVRLSAGATPATLARVLAQLRPPELGIAMTKLRARRTPSNQAHVTNRLDDPLLLAADAATAAAFGFREIETTVPVLGDAPSNAVACLIGAAFGADGVVTVPDAAPPEGRLRVLAAGVPTPGSTGACVGTPLLLPGPEPPQPSDATVVAVVPSGMRYDDAVGRLRALLTAGTQVGAVLVAGDEGVLVANRLPGQLPVIDQVDAVAAAACERLAVKVRPPGHSLLLLADPVALGARLNLSEQEAGDAAAVCRALADHTNAVVGLLKAPPAQLTPNLGEPWVVTADGRRLPLRTACAQLAGWPVGTVRVFGSGSGRSDGDDLFAVDLAAAAEAATARTGSVGRAVLVASLHRPGHPQAVSEAEMLGELLAAPVRSLVTEPAAARIGALTTPGARGDAVVADLGAGTIDVIGSQACVVAAGAGELLTAAGTCEGEPLGHRYAVALGLCLAGQAG
jgi:hypothetical protein